MISWLYVFNFARHTPTLHIIKRLEIKWQIYFNEIYVLKLWFKTDGDTLSSTTICVDNFKYVD